MASLTGGANELEDLISEGIALAEKRPFESWAEIDALAEQLGPVYGPMIVFAAATGLRPGEWIALEHRDLDRDARVVYVRRAFAHGRLQRTKTRRSTRAVPLEALDPSRADRTRRCSFRPRAAAISTCTTSGAAPDVATSSRNQSGTGAERF